MNFKIFYFVLVSFLVSLSSIAEEFEIDNNNTKFNIYSGMLDFSDDGKK